MIARRYTTSKPIAKPEVKVTIAKDTKFAQERIIRDKVVDYDITATCDGYVITRDSHGTDMHVCNVKRQASPVTNHQCAIQYLLNIGVQETAPEKIPA
jgi:hypothetical protein